MHLFVRLKILVGKDKYGKPASKLKTIFELLWEYYQEILHAQTKIPFLIAALLLKKKRINITFTIKS